MILIPILGFHSGYRSSSLSLSPAQRRRENNYFRTPPISREKHKITTNLIDGSRVAGHVYKHLQEDDSTDMESIRRWNFFLFSFVSFVMFVWSQRRKFSLPPLRWGQITAWVIQTAGLTEVKLGWQKDNFGRNEFMTEMLWVQIREQAYEIWSREINEICWALLQLGLSQLIWRTHLIPTVSWCWGSPRYESACNPLSCCCEWKCVWYAWFHQG